MIRETNNEKGSTHSSLSQYQQNSETETRSFLISCVTLWEYDSLFPNRPVRVQGGRTAQTIGSPSAPVSSAWQLSQKLTMEAGYFLQRHGQRWEDFFSLNVNLHTGVTDDTHCVHTAKSKQRPNLISLWCLNAKHFFFHVRTSNPGSWGKLIHYFDGKTW